MEYEYFEAPSTDLNTRSTCTSLKTVLVDGSTLDDPKSVDSVSKIYLKI